MKLAMFTSEGTSPFLKSKRFLTMGYLVNLVILVSLVVLFVILNNSEELGAGKRMILELVAGILFVLELIALTIAFFILRSQHDESYEYAEALTDHRKIMQSILDNTSNPIYIKKINGEYEFVNNSFARMMGKSVREIIGKTDEDLFSSDMAGYLFESDLGVVKTKSEVRSEIKLKNEGVEMTYYAIKFPLFDVTKRIYAIASVLTDISERKVLELSLATKDRFFKLSRDFMVVCEGVLITQVNATLFLTLGYEEKEVLGTSLINYVDETDHAATEEFLLSLTSSNKRRTFENRLLTRKGRIIWVSWTAVPDSETGMTYFVGHDITERRRHDESLKMYKNFFEYSFDALVVANATHFIKISPAYTRILGWEQSDMDAEPFLSFNHPDDMAIATETVNKLIQGEAMVNFRARARCKDGSYKLMEWNATADLSSGLLYGVARDITNQNWLENERNGILKTMHESEQRLRLIVENIGDGVIVANSDKKILLANYMANVILNGVLTEDAELDLSEMFELYYPDEKTVFPSQSLPFERAFNGEATDDVDIILWSPKDRVKKRLLVSGRPIVNQENKVIAVVVTMKDISRYKAMEKELVEARKIIGFKNQ